MGRYYDGDISGKFWFGVQSSDDADFFGVTGYQPNYLEYYFDETNLVDIEVGLKSCRETLGDNKDRLDKFFDSLKAGYNDDMIKAEWHEKYGVELSDSDIQEMLAWYARLDLGERIYDYVKANGECQFNAEL